MSRRRVTKDYKKLETDSWSEGGKKESNFKVGRDMADDGFSDEQFLHPARKFPWKTAAFVVVLVLIGSICLTSAILILVGFLEDEGRFWALLIIGTLVSIPGGYFGFILLNIIFKRGDYSLDDIPSM